MNLTNFKIELGSESLTSHVPVSIQYAESKFKDLLMHHLMDWEFYQNWLLDDDADIYYYFVSNEVDNIIRNKKTLFSKYILTNNNGFYVINENLDFDKLVQDYIGRLPESIKDHYKKYRKDYG